MFRTRLLLVPPSSPCECPHAPALLGVQGNLESPLAALHCLCRLCQEVLLAAFAHTLLLSWCPHLLPSFLHCLQSTWSPRCCPGPVSLFLAEEPEGAFETKVRPAHSPAQNPPEASRLCKAVVLRPHIKSLPAPSLLRSPPPSPPPLPAPASGRLPWLALLHGSLFPQTPVLLTCSHSVSGSLLTCPLLRKTPSDNCI